MSNNELAIESLVIEVLSGYGSASDLSEPNINSYVSCLAEFNVEAVAHAVRQFRMGQVEGHNNAFPPSAPALAKLTAIYNDVLLRIARAKDDSKRLVAYPMGAEPPAGTVPLGPLEVDFGKGRIDMREMAPAEKEFVMKHQRLPPMPDTGPKLGHTSVGTDVSDD